MRRRQNPAGEPEDKDRALARMVSDTVSSLGWLAPETEEEVAAIEESGFTMKPLPPELIDPYAVLERRGPSLRAVSTAIESTTEDSEIVEELARAAREERGKISEEVEELMRKDRDAAERRVQHDDR